MIVPALCLLLGSLLSGCGEEDVAQGPVCMTCAAGTIRGRVLSGAPFTRLKVRAEPASWLDPSYAMVEAEPDSSGEYELLLPLGTYILILLPDEVGTRLYYSPEGVTALRGRARNLHLVQNGQIVEADFPCGGCEILVQTPSGDSDHLSSAHLITAAPPYPWAAVEAEDWGEAGEGRRLFRFPVLPPGRYLASVDLENDETLWLPGSHREGEAEPIEVSIGELASLTADIGPSGRLSGRMSGSWQSGLGEVVGYGSPAIWLFDADSVRLAKAGVHGDGTFDLGLHVPASVRAMVRVGGIAGWIGGRSFETAEVFELAPGEVINGVEYRESGILCRLSGPGAQVVHRGRVLLADAEGRLLSSGESFQSYDPVPIQVSNLSVGSYYLRVEPEGSQDWLPMWYPQADSLSRAEPIVITQEGEVVEVTLHLIQAGRIAGHMSDAAGRPVPDAWIGLYAAEDSVVNLQRAWTDRDTGYFSFSGLADGAYRMGLFGETDEVVWFPGVRDFTEAEAILIRDHAQWDDLAWRVAP